MEQLTGTDSFFLYEERGNFFNHVAMLGLYDPATAPGGKVRYRDILRQFRERLDSSDVWRRRVAAAPFGIDRPYWFEVADVDLEFHVRHIALPAPGDWRQLMIQVARLHSRPLDRGHPLWEAYVIEGLDRIPDLPRGSFAIFAKFHHAAADGLATIEIVKGLHDTKPRARVPAAPPGRRRIADSEPSLAELCLHAVGHGLARSVATTRFTIDTTRKVGTLLLDRLRWRLQHEATSAPPPGLPSFAKAPTTRFSGAISAHRVVEGVGFPLATIRRIREKVADVTINDIFLAVAGGAMRTYLLAKDDLPEQSLVALMPISLRADGKGGGNQVSGVPVPLRTDIADPLERLLAVAAAARQAREEGEALGRDFVKTVFERVPHVVADLLGRLVLLKQFNTTVSNVRGPDAPLYMAGARLLRFYPVSVPADCAGLNHTGVSYDGTLWITAVSCRDMMTDPSVYAECLRASFVDLVAAADALPLPAGAAARQLRGGSSARPAGGKRVVRVARRSAKAASATHRR